MATLLEKSAPREPRPTEEPQRATSPLGYPQRIIGEGDRSGRCLVNAGYKESPGAATRLAMCH